MAYSEVKMLKTGAKDSFDERSYGLVKREAGGNPARSRRCKRGVHL